MLIAQWLAALRYRINRINGAKQTNVVFVRIDDDESIEQAAAPQRVDLKPKRRIVDPDEVRREVNSECLVTAPRGRLHRPDQSVDLSGQHRTAHRELERPQDSIVLSVSISRRQPVRSMRFHSPLEEREAMRRWLDPGKRRGGAPETNSVNIDVNVASFTRVYGWSYWGSAPKRRTRR